MIAEAGPRALTEILYAFSSVSANNGSALGGLNIQTDYYNWSTTVVMLLGRFATMGIALALAGSLVETPALAVLFHAGVSRW